MSKKVAGEKKFGTSLFGFNKVDVNLYLESLIKSYNESLWEKENQISELKRKIEEYKKKLEEIQDEYAAISETREKIANAFIEAQKNAELIIENARKTAAMEKHKLEAECESLRDLIIEKKQKLKKLTEAAVNFGNELESIMNRSIANFRDEYRKAVEDSMEKYIFEHVKDIPEDAAAEDADGQKSGQDNAEADSDYNIKDYE